jgi:hypothetical protein
MENLMMTACCVRHRRPVRWIPAPGWWVHSDGRTCSALWDAPCGLDGHSHLPRLIHR